MILGGGTQRRREGETIPIATQMKILGEEEPREKREGTREKRKGLTRDRKGNAMTLTQTQIEPQS